MSFLIFTFIFYLEDGLKESSCKNCGEIKTEVITARGYHSFPSNNYSWIVTKEATCTEDGEKELKCSDCDEKKTEVIPAGHMYTNGICTVCQKSLITVIIPEMPIAISKYNYSGKIESTVEITSFELVEISKSYDGRYFLTFSWAGEKTYDIEGDNYSRGCSIGYKLYDSEGYVVYNSSITSTAIMVGEKFRNKKFTTSSIDLDPNQTYTLEILNVG